MDLTLTDEQELIKRTAREMLASRSPVSQARALADDPDGYSTELWKEMVELGWMGLALPEEHGGLGMSFLELCLIVEELGAFQVPGPFVPMVVGCAVPIARFGTEEQRQTYLPPVVGGEVVMTYGYLGPEGRWDAPGAGVVAEADGDGFTLRGSTIMVPYAHITDHLLVAARVGADGPPGVFIVDAKTSGIERTPMETVGADRRFRVDLDGLRVGGDTLLGASAEDVSVVEGTAELQAAAMCAEMVGGAQAVLDMTVDYAKEREQFGKPIGSFQAIQHHCANMASDVLGARLVTYEAVWRLAEGLPASEEVSLAKAWTSEAYRRVCALGHQVHGAIGFTREFDLHLFLRHAVSSELAFGDADHHTELVARSIGL